MFASFRHVALLGFVAFTCVASVRAADKWLKLQTKDLIVYSDGSPKDVVEFAVGYTAFRQVFRELFQPPQQPPPAKVLLFRRLGTLQRHLPAPEHKESEMLSFSTDVDGDELLALAVDGDRHQALSETIQFETVWALRRAGYFVPIWMSQGAGEALDSLEVRKDRVRVGEWANDYYDQWQEGPTIGWKHFFEIGTDSPEYVGPKAHGVFHGQAWALMHRILFGSEKTSETFAALALKLRDGDPLEAVSATLGVPPDRFDRELVRHLHSKNANREFPFDADALRRQLTTVPAPEAEVNVQLANLLFAAGKSNDAELELAKAQVLAPASAIVKEARARSAMRAGENDEAVRLYREAIEAGSANAMAYLRSAEQRLNDISGGRMGQPGGGGIGAEEALSEIKKAIVLDPGSTEAYVLLGRALYLVPELQPAQVDGLSRAVARGAAGESIRYYRAALYDRLGRSDDALADYRQIVADPLTGTRLREAVNAKLGEAELKHVVSTVENLAHEAKFDEARAVLDQAAADKTNGAIAAQLQALRGWLDEKQTWDGVRAAYEAKHWSEALTSAKKFLEQFPDSRAANSARRIIERAEKECNVTAGTK